MTKLARRSAAEQRLLLGTLVVVAVASAALRLSSPVRLARLLHRIAWVATRGAGPLAVDALARAVAATSRYVPGASCLPRALALQALLARAGHPVRVCVGLDRAPGEALAGHAWVETLDGQSIAGQECHAYSALLIVDAQGGGHGTEARWRRASG